MKARPGLGSAMPEQAILDVLGFEGLLEQGIGAQIDHAEREILARALPGIGVAQVVERSTAFPRQLIGLNHRPPGGRSMPGLFRGRLSWRHLDPKECRPAAALCRTLDVLLRI